MQTRPPGLWSSLLTRLLSVGNPRRRIARELFAVFIGQALWESLSFREWAPFDSAGRS